MLALNAMAITILGPALSVWTLNWSTQNHSALVGDHHEHLYRAKTAHKIRSSAGKYSRAGRRHISIANFVLARQSSKLMRLLLLIDGISSIWE